MEVYPNQQTESSPLEKKKKSKKLYGLHSSDVDASSGSDKPSNDKDEKVKKKKKVISAVARGIDRRQDDEAEDFNSNASTTDTITESHQSSLSSVLSDANIAGSNSAKSLNTGVMPNLPLENVMQQPAPSSTIPPDFLPNDLNIQVASPSPISSALAENIRSSLLSPLSRIRAAGARQRSGSSPGRNPAQIRAQVQAETEKLAKAGNATARRILHRSKSESTLTMNSWDVGYSGAPSTNITSDHQLLARAHAAATRRTRYVQKKHSETSISLPAPIPSSSTSTSYQSDSVGDQLMSPIKAPTPLADRMPSPSSSEEDVPKSPSPPVVERTSSKRTLATFGRKSSYHKLSRKSSGVMIASTDTAASSPMEPSSSGERAKSDMDAFLKYVPNHLGNSHSAEGIALIHALLVPSTFLLDHLIALFKSNEIPAELTHIENLKHDIISFFGKWVSIVPFDFADDFVLEKKLKDFVAWLQTNSDRSIANYGTTLQIRINEAAAQLQELDGKTLSNTQILDLAASNSASSKSAENSSGSSRPKLKYEKSQATLQQVRTVSMKEIIEQRATEPADPNAESKLPTFEDMLDLVKKTSSRTLRHNSSGATSPNPSSPGPSTPKSRKSKKETVANTNPAPETPNEQEESAADSRKLSPDRDEFTSKPKLSKKLLIHLAEVITSNDYPSILNISPSDLAKQWTLLDHATICKLRASDTLRHVGKPSRSIILTDIASRFNHTTCWIATQILKIPNVKKRALAITHFISVAENLLDLTNLHGFISVITGLSQHAISRLNATWKKVDPRVKKTYDAMVALASPLGNFKQLRTIQDNALPPYIPTPAMFLRDLLFIIDGNGGSFVQNAIIKTDMILLSRKVLLRILLAQQTNYRFYGIDVIQHFLQSGDTISSDELVAVSEKVESGRDL